MGLLANLKIRTKMLVAMLPLALMTIGASVYSSVESQRIDTWYSKIAEEWLCFSGNPVINRPHDVNFVDLLPVDCGSPRGCHPYR